MNRHAWVLLLLALASCRRQPAVAPLAASVARAHGAVWLNLPNGQRQAIAGGPLVEGETIATGEDGGAVVLLGPGRELELRANARLKLRREHGVLVPELQGGLVVSRATVDTSVELTVLTPFGITRVPGGRSEATIGVDREGVRIDVTFGAIAFVDSAGKTTTAGANQSLAVTLGKVELVRALPAAPPAPAAEALDVMLSSEIGPLLIRAPGEKGFSPRRAAPAPAGTNFRMGNPGGRARLVGPGLRVRLEGGAAGRVGEASRTDSGRHFSLALERGSALISLEGGQAHEVMLEGRQPVSLRATEASTFSVTASRGGKTTVVLLAGNGELAVGGQERRLAINERAQIQGKRVEVASRPSSDVVLPSARGLHVYADGLSEVTLSWTGAGERALVEVSNDPDFKDLILSGEVKGSSITVPAPRRADLYWRVTGRGDKAGDKVIAGHARFEPDRRRSVLDLEHPHNLVSEGGPMTTVYFTGVVPTLTFSYAARPGAARYRLRVYRAGELGKPIVERVVSDTRAPVDANVLEEGSYVWHAVPLDAKGAEVGGGRMNKLELVYDNALTRLAIGSPKPNERLTGSEVTTLGVAPLGSRLYINGKPARLDEKGRFTEKVGRTSALVFRLVTRSGAESYWIRRLRVGS
jgi:hypothetical protein